MSGRAQEDSGGGCGCLLTVIAIALLVSGAGWYFAVKENRDFVGAKTIRVAAAEFAEVRRTISNRSTAEDVPAIEMEIHRLVNLERQKHNLPSLDWQGEIAAIARAHSQDMATYDYFDHINPEGENPTDRAVRGGYPCRKFRSYGLAENILQSELYSSKIMVWYVIPAGKDWMDGDEIARRSVKSWMFSPGHRKNILTPSYDRAGVGGAIVGETIYLTQNFC